MSEPPYPNRPGDDEQPPPSGWGIPSPQGPGPAWSGAGAAGYPEDPLISRDYAGWWNRSVTLLRTYWRQLLALQLIGAVAGLLLRTPAAAFQALTSTRFRPGQPIDPDTASAEMGSLLGAAGLTLAGVLLAALISALVTLACIRLLVVGVTGGRPDVGGALRGSLPRLFPLIGWGLLGGLVVLVGLCACLVPGFYFAAVLLVLPAVVLFERGGAIGRCFKLFHGDFGASIARVATILAIIVAGILVSLVIGGIIGAGIGITGATDTAVITGAVINSIVGIIVGVGLGLLTAPLTLTTYADMRARVEPLSTAVLARDLDQQRPGFYDEREVWRDDNA